MCYSALDIQCSHLCAPGTAAQSRQQIFLAQIIPHSYLSVKRLIQEMRGAGVQLGIATTTTHSNVTTLLETSLDMAAPGWFDVIAAGNVIPRKKPAPDVYHYALQELSGEPDTCLVIEDSQNGLRAALGAGLKTAITESKYTQTHDFSGASLVVDHLGEPDMPATASKGSLNTNCFIDLSLLEGLLT